MNIDVVPDTAEAMDTSAIPTAEKRKPLSVRQSKAKRQKPKPPTQEKREFQEDPSTTTKSPKARRVRGKQPQPQALGAIGAPGFWFPEWCFWFPWCFFLGMVFSVPGGFGGSQGVFTSRAGVFSVPRFGFAVPGMVCWAPVGVFCSRNGVSGSGPEGTAWRCL